jgi:signal transduction histidine kinase
MKTDFISTISHEFKTPLTSIMMGLSLLLDENLGTLNKRQKDILMTINEDSEQLSSLVSNLLQLSKIESSNAIFNIEACSIIGIIENSIKNFYPLAEEKEIILKYEALDNLPKVLADFEKITWALNNLISNSMKYTSAGDEVCISASIKDKQHMCITVKDTGCGIPNEYIPCIFDKFAEFKNSNYEMKSSGLGLGIAKEIIEALSGEIWCESKLDEGSSFTFTLPIQKE